MPQVIKPSPQHQPASGVGHDLPYLCALRRGIAVDPAMLATRLFGLQGTGGALDNGIGHKPGTFNAHLTLTQTARQCKRLPVQPAMFPGAVHLDKRADQPDIVQLLFIHCFHSLIMPQPP